MDFQGQNCNACILGGVRTKTCRCAPLEIPCKKLTRFSRRGKNVLNFLGPLHAQKQTNQCPVYDNSPSIKCQKTKKLAKKLSSLIINVHNPPASSPTKPLLSSARDGEAPPCSQRQWWRGRRAWQPAALHQEAEGRSARRGKVESWGRRGEARRESDQSEAKGERVEEAL